MDVILLPRANDVCSVVNVCLQKMRYLVTTRMPGERHHLHPLEPDFLVYQCRVVAHTGNYGDNHHGNVIS